MPSSRSREKQSSNPTCWSLQKPSSQVGEAAAQSTSCLQHTEGCPDPHEPTALRARPALAGLS